MADLAPRFSDLCCCGNFNPVKIFLSNKNSFSLHAASSLSVVCGCADGVQTVVFF